MREKLSVKAKSEPKFRFYNLKRLVVETETLKCPWAGVRRTSHVSPCFTQGESV